MVPDRQKVLRDGGNGRTVTWTTLKYLTLRLRLGIIKQNQGCSNMLANIMAADTPLLPLESKFNFLEHGHVAHQRELGMQQHGSKCRQRYNKKRNISNVIFDRRPMPDPRMDLGVGVKMSI